MRPPRLLLALVACLLAATPAACTGDDSSAPPPRGEGEVEGVITVFAASSLTEAFTRMGRDFERENPGTTVRFSFGGSSTLAQQIIEGAPVDVFAAADPATMNDVQEAEQAGEPTVFARNRLQIAVPAGNPGDVRGLRDLADPSLAVALCAPEVPCGSAAQRAFDSAGVEPAADTLEQDVKAVLSKVEMDEVDAGLVYHTDVLASGKGVQGIVFPEAADAINDYPVVTLTNAPNVVAGRAFVDYVRSPEGQSTLVRAGFERP
ncbi:MAG: molybdate ABC transporter substrate-binding protein [Actinomycetes bacterium]